MPRLDRITASLRPLEATHLEVVDESYMHSSGPDAETHFKVVVVAPAFDGMGLLARHRRVNELLRAELASGLHALSIHAFSPAQWAENAMNLDSPACRGGAGK